ncbi:MAG: Phosphate ABC transporter, inner membrane subunit PstA [Candidatus Tokpelaia hoelldobleri]|uniref:Phosphate transport system permease protein PstA n=1 Tax=Candidatus Tokpelaia hoelldobleri TaxID=1902579 RepID=A0A1U9JWH9_9HYPH|nr:MAG: Phosphate ABC transporter, inner membrane subunit PstA [Candidatus Tokpelaia hoelldoblerii]
MSDGTVKPPRRDIGLKRRYRAGRRFHLYGLGAVCLSLMFLGMLLWSVFSQGISAFWQTSFTLPVKLEASVIDPKAERGKNPDVLNTANYPLLVRNALAEKLGVAADDRAALRAVNRMISPRVRRLLRDMVVNNPQLIGTTQTITVLAAADVDSAYKGQIDLSVPEANRKISDRQAEWIKHLAADGSLYKTFNAGLFTSAPSSRPEAAGLGVALIGSFYMMIVVLGLALPIGVAAAVYLEEYARRSKFTDLIEVNINNLAAVPSIVFGLLGLSVFIGFFGLPRSSALVGGLVLMLMTLPTIIIATRAALAAVPPSIRAAALGLGASKTQAIFGHVLPLALPGILTGSIIGLARALGETAPLLLIGMVAFVANYPATPLDPATALPVQIYMWAGEAERAFVERTYAAIIVLLLFLAVMNVAAVVLRRRLERRW